MDVNMDAIFKKIKEVDERNAGVVTTKQIEEIGICRGLIKHLFKMGN